MRKHRAHRIVSCLRALILGALTFLLSACALTRIQPGLGKKPVVKPVVAVSDFENRAGFKGQWDLGDGMAEVLINELIETERVTVLERKYLSDVIGEIRRQSQALFRTEGRVPAGRLKNARYLIRGVLSDFHVSGDKSGWFASQTSRFRVRGSSARITLNVYVVEVESGQIIGSAETTGRASRLGLGAAVEYKEVAFGGDAYFKTPLGKATRQAMQKAVREILQILHDEEWDARIASGGPHSVLVNGGKNVRLEVGEILLVRDEGSVITDPVTGDVLEELPGPVIGKIRVEVVDAISARALLLEGSAARGNRLERLR